MTNNLASLNLNAAPLSSGGLGMGGSHIGSKVSMPGMESNSSSGTPYGLPNSGLGNNLQSPTQSPFSPMGGSNAADPMRSRTASFADSDPIRPLQACDPARRSRRGSQPTAAVHLRPSVRLADLR